MPAPVARAPHVIVGDVERVHHGVATVRTEHGPMLQVVAGKASVGDRVAIVNGRLA